MEDLVCVRCDNNSFLAGPRAGLGQNIKCECCGKVYLISPLGLYDCETQESIVSFVKATAPPKQGIVDRLMEFVRRISHRGREAE